MILPFHLSSKKSNAEVMAAMSSSVTRSVLYCGLTGFAHAVTEMATLYFGSTPSGSLHQNLFIHHLDGSIASGWNSCSRRGVRKPTSPMRGPTVERPRFTMSTSNRPAARSAATRSACWLPLPPAIVTSMPNCAPKTSRIGPRRPLEDEFPANSVILPSARAAAFSASHSSSNVGPAGVGVAVGGSGGAGVEPVGCSAGVGVWAAVGVGVGSRVGVGVEAAQAGASSSADKAATSDTIFRCFATIPIIRHPSRSQATIRTIRLSL